MKYADKIIKRFNAKKLAAYRELLQERNAQVLQELVQEYRGAYLYTETLSYKQFCWVMLRQAEKQLCFARFDEFCASFAG